MKRIYFVLFLLFFIPNILFAKINDVAFISQVPPGDWDNTLNCGQTSYYMVLSYINGIKSEDLLDYNEIKKIDDWLYQKYGDPIRNYNGYYTNVNKLNTIANERDNVKNSAVFYGVNDFDNLKKEIDNGNVVIVAVRINMKANRDGHFMVLIGYDDQYVYLNDPGKMLGRKRKYLIQDFLDVWKTQNYSYVLIKPEQKVESNNDKVENNVEVSKSDNSSNILLDETTQGVDSNTINTEDKNNVEISKIDDSSNILLNKTITEDNRILQTIIKDNGDQLQIITVDAELDDKVTNADNYVDDSSDNKEEDYPYLDENNWMHINDNLVIDYNVPQTNNSSEEIVEGSKQEDSIQVQEESNNIVSGFEFNKNYVDKSLKISLSWTNPDALLLDLDVKKDDGAWENIDVSNNALNYDYYIKDSKAIYYFRLRMFDGNSYTDYKTIEQGVDIEPLVNGSMLTSITSDTVFGENMIYFCDHDCILDKNANLLVEPGAQIKMSKDARFVFLGNVVFAGNNDNKIYIMPSDGDNESGEIGPIYFYQNDYVELDNVDIGYSEHIEFTNKVGDMIKVDGVKNFIVRDSSCHNIYLASGANMNIVNSNVKIIRSKFYNSMYGFKISQSSGEISENEFTDNHYNVVLYNVDKTLKFYRNKILNAVNIAISGQNILADIKDNVLENNRFNLISMAFLNIDSGEFTLSKGIYNIYEANIGKDAILNVESGTIFKSYTDHGKFKIDGKMMINGTKEDPVIFTSFFDDSYGGDSNLDGDAFLPNPGDWGYLEFTNNSSGSVIKNTIFEYGGHYSFNNINHGVIYVNGAKDLLIQDSIFNNGFYRDIEINSGSNITVINNKILNTTMCGLDIQNGSNIIVENNEFTDHKNAAICYKDNGGVSLIDNIFMNNSSDVIIVP
ncbi:MAG TPA: C39 family peptidase [bacterium]|nr:C39 family peptidase [bacterium]